MVLRTSHENRSHVCKPAYSERCTRHKSACAKVSNITAFARAVCCTLTTPGRACSATCDPCLGLRSAACMSQSPQISSFGNRSALAGATRSDTRCHSCRNCLMVNVVSYLADGDTLQVSKTRQATPSSLLLTNLGHTCALGQHTKHLAVEEGAITFRSISDSSVAALRSSLPSARTQHTRHTD